MGLNGIADAGSNLVKCHDQLVNHIDEPMTQSRKPARAERSPPQHTVDANIGRLLHGAMRAYNDRALTGIRGLGHGQATLAHATVLPHFDEEGTRLTVLADRSGTTKQAVSQLIRELEAAGYVERAPDETDRRAELIRLTMLGRKFRRDAYKVKAAQEQELTDALGGVGKRRLRELLTSFPWRTTVR